MLRRCDDCTAETPADSLTVCQRCGRMICGECVETLERNGVTRWTGCQACADIEVKQ